MVEIIGILLPLLGFGVGGFFIYSANNLKKVKKIIETLPTTKISDVKPGIIEVTGVAHSAKEKPLKSPLTSKDCFYYKYNIEEKHTKRDNKGHTTTSWKTIRSGVDSVPFYVDDGSGKVLIDPKEADLSVKINEQANSSFGKDPPEHIKAFLKANNISFEGFLGINKTMRYNELLITQNQKLFIIGTAQEGEGGLTIKKGTAEKLFMVSDSEEKDILKSYGMKYWSNLIGGIFFVLLGLGLFFFITVRMF
ncbi:MAG: GIDE domain-containing protein [archaeon]